MPDFVQEYINISTISINWYEINTHTHTHSHTHISMSTISINWYEINTHTHTHTHRGVCGVMAIIVGNGHCDTSLTMLTAFLITLISLEKPWVQLLFLWLWVNSMADWVL